MSWLKFLPVLNEHPVCDYESLFKYPLFTDSCEVMRVYKPLKSNQGNRNRGAFRTGSYEDRECSNAETCTHRKQLLHGCWILPCTCGWFVADRRVGLFQTGYHTTDWWIWLIPIIKTFGQWFIQGKEAKGSWETHSSQSSPYPSKLKSEGAVVVMGTRGGEGETAALKSLP